jgi:hypothetical protein
MRKQYTKRLDDIAPGWADAERPAQYVKTIDPKHRQEAARLVAWLSANPKKSTPKKKPKKG